MSELPQLVMVCLPASGSAIQPSISCGSFEGVAYYATAIQAHTLSTDQYQAFQKTTEPFDVGVGASYFAFGLGVVVACWVLAHTTGIVLQSVRSF